MNTNCVDCNIPIDSKTGLYCVTCRVPFCVSDCLQNHAAHKFQNLSGPQSGGGGDLQSRVLESEKLFSDLKYTSNALVDFIKNFDSEIMNHQLKIFSLKDRVNRSGQGSKQSTDLFQERHNNVLKNIIQIQNQVYQQAKEGYKYWGLIASYNYDEVTVYYY